MRVLKREMARCRRTALLSIGGPRQRRLLAERLRDRIPNPNGHDDLHKT